MRKLVRVIIETNGGDGKKLNEQMKGTNYSRGRVYFNDERVGEWDESRQGMVLKGKGLDYKADFERLMGIE